ncbi:DJ-1/PfpI family protein [Lewinella cohaerens]|uniref:DJ-1/PfpI family protein n=1 Tax=Lewinella cohaerens TaxID=70995 RepID=UPI00035E55DB|nr:DJ-1/PfpI family protein [Lewinella cohaerens]
MSKLKIILLLLLPIGFGSCGSENAEANSEISSVAPSEPQTDTSSKYFRPIKEDLPTIGLLMYDGVLQSEVIATSDVFSKLAEDGTRLFNVVTIAESEKPITTEEGIRILPDYTFENSPKLEALFIPSAYDMYEQVHNEAIVAFIIEKNEEVKYVVSNCAGAQLIGASGIADGKRIVTWIGGGEQLQKDYPNLKVENDSLVTFVEDGRFSSSNGNLASYITALNLLEKMTSAEHRAFVASYLYLDRLQNWDK